MNPFFSYIVNKYSFSSFLMNKATLSNGRISYFFLCFFFIFENIFYRNYFFFIFIKFLSKKKQNPPIR